MLSVHFRLVGTSPLLCRNVRLADKDDPIVKAIDAITAKSNKTESDRREIALLEWRGGIYTSSRLEGPVMPTRLILATFINTAKLSRLGASVNRALSFTALDVPIIYEGTRDLEELIKCDEFHDRQAVGIKTAKTMRTRPMFRSWMIEADAKLAEDLLDLEDLKRIVELAGMANGLADGRKIGYGRFTGEVTIS